jgi:hypothetical protein
MPKVEQASSPVSRLLHFITERHEIYRRKRRGEPRPWTRDGILRDWRFCNVYRELDTVTEWIAENWRAPNSEHPDLWFAMCVARWINWPDTLAEIGYPLPWQPARVLAVLKARAARGEKVWTGAYTIGTQGTCYDKPVFVVERVLDPLWQNREQLRPRLGDTLASFAARLMLQYSFKGFMTGQVIADVKYVGPLRRATDWRTWAISGPGSRRGLNRVLNRPVDARLNEDEWLQCLQELHKEITPMIRAAMLPRLHAQDLQNCLCEWDKYERVRLGEGKPRSRYPGQAINRKATTTTYYVTSTA